MSRTGSFSWLPNALTLARCALAFWVAWLIYTLPTLSLIPFAAFVAVAMTDFVDGFAARHLGAVSKLGAFLDPVADKLLVGLSLVALTVNLDGALVLLVPTAAIIVRDVLITGLRLIPGIEVPVSQLAKWKTALEMVGIGSLLLGSAVIVSFFWVLGLVLVWLAAMLAVYTLGLYVGALLANQNDRANS
jgi:CDP-diacylglycerol--glycerol-3-phosphate 3-phosphatidyltransferase